MVYAAQVRDRTRAGVAPVVVAWTTERACATHSAPPSPDSLDTPATGGSSPSGPGRRDPIAGPHRGSSIRAAVAMNRATSAIRTHLLLRLSCPRCGLTITPRARWLAIEHCPRCLARARLPVRLIPSAPGSEGGHPRRSRLSTDRAHSRGVPETAPR